MPSQFYRLNSDKVAAELVEDEAIIINVATGNYYNTEGIGGWVWQQCTAGKGLDEIAALAESMFVTDAATARADLDGFFTSLEEEELVTGSDERPIAGAEAEAVPGEANRTAYKAPRLVAYRDLKDLLALDPPMPRLGADRPSAAASPGEPVQHPSR